MMLLFLACAAPSPHVPAFAEAETPTGTLLVLPDPPLYGFWGLNGFVSPLGFQQLKASLGLTVFQVACSDPAWGVASLLPMVQQAGLKLTLRLTRDHEAYTTASGDFDIEAWKKELQPWEDSGIQAFIDNGTLIGHMLLDDIHNFAGHDPDASELEEMARYSKERFPGLMTYVRDKATGMPEPASGRYQEVDACVNQYEAMEGTVETYAPMQAAAARRLNLGIINGLNIADGGDGSSGQPGWRKNHWAMSALEIRHYGQVLAEIPGQKLFLNWEYDGEEKWSDGSIGSRYFQQPDLERALFALGQQVKAP